MSNLSEFLFRRGPIRNAIAIVISLTTSPYVVIPVLSFWIITRYSTTHAHGLRWTLISIFFTTVVPFTDVAVEMWRGKITDVHVKIREERIEPFVVAIASSLLGTMLLYADGAPREILALGVTVVVNGLAFAALSFSIKLSVHIAVLTVGIFAIGFLVCPAYYLVYCVMPVVIWGRIYRGRHSIWEGVVAMAVAFVVTLTVFLLLSRARL